MCTDQLDLTVGGKTQVFADGRIGRGRSRDSQLSALQTDRYDLHAFDHVAGNQPEGFRTDLGFFEVNDLQAELLGQRREELIFGYQPLFDKNQSDPLTFAGRLLIQRLFDLLTSHELGFDEYVANPNATLALSIAGDFVDGLFDDDLGDGCLFGEDFANAPAS